MATLADELEVIARKWIEDIETVKPSQVPEILYHYTDAAGLVGMLSFHKIWLTDMRFLNDKTELVHTKNLVNNVFEEFRQQKEDDLVNNLIEKTINWQARSNDNEAFNFSLSEKADDLSQWRGYAREGSGFTLGFSGARLIEAKNEREEFGFAKVDYDVKSQTKALLSALREIEVVLRDYCAKNPENTEEYVQESSRMFDWVIESRSVLNKHHSFASEAEWRVFAYHPTDTDESYVKVRASGVRLVPYLEDSIAGEVGAKLPIVSIGIGPAFAGGEEIYAVQALCRSSGYDPIIYVADTPYRGF